MSRSKPARTGSSPTSRFLDLVLHRRLAALTVGAVVGETADGAQQVGTEGAVGAATALERGQDAGEALRHEIVRVRGRPAHAPRQRPSGTDVALVQQAVGIGVAHAGPTDERDVGVVGVVEVGDGQTRHSLVWRAGEPIDRPDRCRESLLDEAIGPPARPGPASTAPAGGPRDRTATQEQLRGHHVVGLAETGGGPEQREHLCRGPPQARLVLQGGGPVALGQAARPRAPGPAARGRSGPAGSPSRSARWRWRGDDDARSSPRTTWSTPWAASSTTTARL